MRSAGGSRYKVVRCFGVRPSERTSPSMFSGGISWPKLAPAAREMLSFIKVPPMSLQPASRQAAVRAPSQPRETDPAVFGPSEHAPGLPRLALDGAIEAVKLPIKVGANITFRALDAVTKGLRGR